MKRISGVLLLLVALPVWATEMPPGCAWLCGSWAFDAARSDTSEAVVEAALEKFKETSGSRRSPPAGGALYSGPQTRAEFRTQLLAEIAPPASLVLGERENEILVRIGDSFDRRIFPGEPHSRVDSLGTAKIRAEWKKDALVIDERYSGKHGQTETYALQPDGSLQLTRVFERAGIKPMRQRLYYRRR
jgi:hypothetical protein